MDLKADIVVILLINGISLKEGGGLLVFKRLVEGFCALFPDVHIHIVVNSRVSNHSEFNLDKVKRWVYPFAEKFPFTVRLWYEFLLPRLAKCIKADILFSLTNYLPSRLKLPSLLLVQNAGHFSDIFQKAQYEAFPDILDRLAWRTKTSWVYQSIMKASMVTVQTKSLSNSVSEKLNFSEQRLRVIPHGSGTCNHVETSKSFPRNDFWRIGYITMYGVQKNFNVLFQAIAELRRQGRKVVLVLSLNPNSKKNAEVLNDACKLGIGDLIENHGDVPFEEVQRIYHSLDLFVYPSFCESFGFSMVEAMACAIPILVANIPGNREVTGVAGIPFSPFNYLNLTEKICKLMEDEKAYTEASRASLKKAGDFSWSTAVKETMALIQCMADGTC